MKHFTSILLFTALLVMASLSGYSQQNPNVFGPNQISCNVFVPNAFTPNGDGINDKFTIKSSDNCAYESFTMTIFDRWGRMVYTADNPNPENSWDGMFEGQELDQGVYIWNIQAKIRSLNDPSADAVIINRQGTVVVIR